ncbi:hypothetical protein OKW22_000614 [Bacilli bacterium PM5-3]|nr:hypothetical protein [Bacilli bacterium PM5-3]MDH6603856.1 hypothetical protein [Bacilli bacterium PM5-9]
MKILKKIAAVGGALLVIGIILGVIASITLQKPFFEVITYSSYTKIDEAILKSDINEVVINFEVAEVNIQESKDNKISYEYYGTKKSNFEANVEGKTVHFKNETRKFLTGFNFEGNKLNLYLPKDKIYKLDVDSDVSSINISKVTASSISANGNVGEIKIIDCIVKDYLDIRSDVGAVEVRNVKEPKKVDVITDVGAIKIINMYSKTVSLKSDVGTIDYKNDDLNYIVSDLIIKTDVGSENIKVGR